MKRILSLTRQAIQKYNMIEQGDRIAVAVSGGKDSFVLLEALIRLSEFYPEKFEVCAIYADIGFEVSNADVIYEFCKNKDIPFFFEKTSIKQIVFDEMNSQNPCSLCSKMRRAVLCSLCEKHGYNKLALGHNRDDANETLIMNLFYNGKIECFEPVTYYEDKNLSLIRPMVSVPEYMVSSCAKKLALPVCQKVCPADGSTDREKIKELIQCLSKDNRKLSDNLFSAIQKHDIFVSKEMRDKK